MQKTTELNYYMDGLLMEEPPQTAAIRQAAEEAHVPIMHRDAMAVVEHYIHLLQPEKILEIGAAVGYSAIRMALAGDAQSKVVTIEKNEQMISQARDNIGSSGLEGRIDIIPGDATDVHSLISQKAPFDLLIIDAAKGQYQRFFDLYTPFLNSGGLIIADNVLFRGFVYTKEAEIPKRFRRMVHKLKAFNQQLAEHPDYRTVFLPIGDGLAVSSKK